MDEQMIDLSPAPLVPPEAPPPSHIGTRLGRHRLARKLPMGHSFKPLLAHPLLLPLNECYRRAKKTLGRINQFQNAKHFKTRPFRLRFA